MEAKKLAQRIALIAKNKKAQKVIILEMTKVATFCDYFVIASATSLRQTNAVAEAIREELEKERIKIFSPVVANDESGWIALDCGAVIAHIFYKPLREFYDLERLWSDARKVRLTKPRP